MKSSWKSQRKAETNNRRIAQAFMVSAKGERMILGDLSAQLRARRQQVQQPKPKEECNAFTWN